MNTWVEEERIPLYPRYKCDDEYGMYVHAYTYVTVFWKTDHLHTRTEIHLSPVRDRHTHALSRNTKY